MPVYATNFDSDNISIGPCFVYFNGVHVGHTFGGVTLSLTQNVYELKSDQYGDTPVRVLDAGLVLEVTANLTEATFENLKMLFASATEQGTGESAYLSFGRPVGTPVTTGELILEPTDGSSVIQIYKGAPNIGSTIEIGFTTDNQRVFATKFVGLIDDSRPIGDQLFRIGGEAPEYAYDLTLAVTGDGSITINGVEYTSLDSPHTISTGGSVTMTAAYDGTSDTLTWSGTDSADVDGTFPTFTLLMDEAKSISADFTTA